jgi:hypothetical protein
MNNEITYVFIDENNVVLGSSIIIEGDTEAIERNKILYGAASYHIFNPEISHPIIVGETVWYEDRFVEPKLFPSWIFDKDKNHWMPPVLPPENAYDPENPVTYKWNEETLSWDMIPIQE